MAEIINDAKASETTRLTSREDNLPRAAIHREHNAPHSPTEPNSFNSRSATDSGHGAGSEEDPLASAMDSITSESVPIVIEQKLALYLYIGIVIVGQLASWLGPEPSYFSLKRNLFNVYFVKKAWFWTTVIYAAFIASSKSACAKSSHYLGTPAQIACRYAAATLWWVLFAQWFFGLPIMDRVFLLSGGSCEGLAEQIGAKLSGKSISSAVCKKNGGQWTGGHDPSGHVFLLVHSSLFLLFEMLPYLMAEARPKLGLAHKAALGLLGLWAWMLLMTSMYFHSFAEKLVGLVWAYGQVLFVYVFARDTSWGQALFG